MEYTCIYEALPNKLLTIPFILLSAIELILTIYSVINWKYNSIGGKVGISITFIIILLIMISTIYKYCSSHTIWNTYINNDCLVIEGTIEDYEIGTDEKVSFPDRFTVNGVGFIISNSPSLGYGYTLRQYDGGMLHNGLYCKIFYVPYNGENVIMKVLIEQYDD